MSVGIICKSIGVFRGRKFEIYLDERTEVEFLIKFIDREDSFSVNWEGDPAKLLTIRLHGLESSQEERFEIEPRRRPLKYKPLQLIPLYLEALPQVRSGSILSDHGCIYTKNHRVAVLHDLIRRLVPIIQESDLLNQGTDLSLYLWEDLLNPRPLIR